MELIISSVITLPVIFMINYLFKKYNLTKMNYRNIKIPYSGGTIIFTCILISMTISYLLNYISFFKLFFFTVALLCVYIVGIIDDLFGRQEIKGLKNNVKLLLKRNFSTGIIKAFGIIIISSYIYFIFKEEYWLIKGLIVALFSNLFNVFDLRPARSLKLYFIFVFFLSYKSFQWNHNLFIVSTGVIVVYYYFDAFGYCMLGDSGSNLIGFIIGMIIVEVFSLEFFKLFVILIALLLLQIYFDRYSYTNLVEKFDILDFLDRILTERQGKNHVKS